MATNRLAGEKSPYLQQHARNPVDWYPWGQEALSRARVEDKPILVSIGYSSCHWCHVMERESFEDSATAKLMNENFINIKVDREERPDVDAIHMEAVQALTGQGGWPLNVFLTSEGKPFFGGTYFPPRPGHGMASWTQVLQSVADAYRVRRDDVSHNAEVLTEYVTRAQHVSDADSEPGLDVLHAAYQSAASQFDWSQGGFGGAPKFPQPLSLEFVLRMGHRFSDDQALDFLRLTLDRMAAGGIYDQLGGGFHRYSVDDHWLVPHFEKMLYDNALLARIYLQAFVVTRMDHYRTVVEETLDYLLRDMRSSEGGFFSAEDADSEGVEGKYYVWTPEQIDDVLGPETGRILQTHYGIKTGGNWEGATILTRPLLEEATASRLGLSVAEVRQSVEIARIQLLHARSRRVAPGKDMKILTSWNALAIRALAEAGRILDRPDYLHAAEETAFFILSSLRPEGRLVRSYLEGPAGVPAFLEDYAYLLEAVLTLYETAFRPEHLQTAASLSDEIVSRFWDEESQTLYDVASDAADLVVRPRGIFDNPIPSGNAAASMGLLRLGSLTGDDRYERQAHSALRSARDLMVRAPLGLPYLLSALDFHVSPPIQIAIVGNADNATRQHLIDTVYGRYLPNRVVSVGGPDETPLLRDRQLLGGEATAYVCEHFTCQLPVTDPEALALQLQRADSRQTTLPG